MIIKKHEILIDEGREPNNLPFEYMIGKDIQEKLLGIIRDKMIPEYKNSLLYKEKLKEEYVRYLENDYLTERDRDLILKFPDHINCVAEIPIAYYRYYGGKNDLKIEYFTGNWKMIKDEDMVIKLDHKLPVISESIYSLKELDNEEWKKIGPLLHQYINARNIYIKKLNLAYEFLNHKNATVTLIKKEFPELYKLYKS